MSRKKKRENLLPAPIAPTPTELAPNNGRFPIAPHTTAAGVLPAGTTVPTQPIPNQALPPAPADYRYYYVQPPPQPLLLPMPATQPTAPSPGNAAAPIAIDDDNEENNHNACSDIMPRQQPREEQELRPPKAYKCSARSCLSADQPKMIKCFAPGCDRTIHWDCYQCLILEKHDLEHFVEDCDFPGEVIEEEDEVEDDNDGDDDKNKASENDGTASNESTPVKKRKKYTAKAKFFAVCQKSHYRAARSFFRARRKKLKLGVEKKPEAVVELPVVAPKKKVSVRKRSAWEKDGPWGPDNTEGSSLDALCQWLKTGYNYYIYRNSIRRGNFRKDQEDFPVDDAPIPGKRRSRAKRKKLQRLTMMINNNDSNNNNNARSYYGDGDNTANINNPHTAFFLETYGHTNAAGGTTTATRTGGAIGDLFSFAAASPHLNNLNSDAIASHLAGASGGTSAAYAAADDDEDDDDDDDEQQNDDEEGQQRDELLTRPPQHPKGLNAQLRETRLDVAKEIVIYLAEASYRKPRKPYEIILKMKSMEAGFLAAIDCYLTSKVAEKKKREDEEQNQNAVGDGKNKEDDDDNTKENKRSRKKRKKKKSKKKKRRGKHKYDDDDEENSNDDEEKEKEKNEFAAMFCGVETEVELHDILRNVETLANMEDVHVKEMIQSELCPEFDYVKSIFMPYYIHDKRAAVKKGGAKRRYRRKYKTNRKRNASAMDGNDEEELELNEDYNDDDNEKEGGGVDGDEEEEGEEAKEQSNDDESKKNDNDDSDDSSSSSSSSSSSDSTTTEMDDFDIDDDNLGLADLMNDNSYGDARSGDDGRNQRNHATSSSKHKRSKYYGRRKSKPLPTAASAAAAAAAAAGGLGTVEGVEALVAAAAKVASSSKKSTSSTVRFLVASLRKFQDVLEMQRKRLKQERKDWRQERKTMKEQLDRQEEEILRLEGIEEEQKWFKKRVEKERREQEKKQRLEDERRRRQRLEEVEEQRKQRRWEEAEKAEERRQLNTEEAKAMTATRLDMMKKYAELVDIGYDNDTILGMIPDMKVLVQFLSGQIPSSDSATTGNNTKRKKNRR